MSTSEQRPDIDVTESEDLVRSLREELIKTQLLVVGLNDKLVEKDREKNDAIAILGQAELRLESTLTSLSDLKILRENDRLELEAKLDSAKEESRRRDETVLVLTQSLNETRQDLASVSSIAAERAANLNQIQGQLEQTQQTLIRTQHELAVERHRLQRIFRSSLWRMGRPWRALFGPKI